MHREYGLGRGRTDLLVVWQHQQFVLELKVLHHSLERTLAEGLKQTAEYMDRQASSEGHLILFDRAPERSWEEKIFRREEQVEGKSITVWGT